MRSFQVFSSMLPEQATQMLRLLSEKTPGMYIQALVAASAAMKARPKFLKNRPIEKQAQAVRRAMARVNRAAEQARRQLSDRPYVKIEEEYLLERKGQPLHLSLEFSRDDLEEMIAPYVDETLDAVHTALKGANLTVSDLDEVLLAGDAMRAALIGRRFGVQLRLRPRGSVGADL